MVSVTGENNMYANATIKILYENNNEISFNTLIKREHRFL